MDKILYLENRIHKLSMKNPVDNKNIIAKLRRQVRRLERQ